MLRLVLGVMVACVLAGPALGVQTLLSEAEVKGFLDANYGVTVDNEIASLSLVSGGFDLTAWAFGGLLPQGQPVSGLLDPTGVVRFDTLGTLSLSNLGLGRLAEPGEDIDLDLGFASTVALAPLENESALIGLSIADPHYGWMEIGLPGGIGTAPSLLGLAIQPIPDIPIKAGAMPIPEPSALVLLAIGALGGACSRRRRRSR